MRAAGTVLHGAVPALGAAVRKLEQDVPRYRIAMVAACPMPARRGTPLRIERLTEALIARGHHEELAMHVRAARTNGLTVDEIKEVILQSAIYCGVPDANTAFRIAQGVLEETSVETPEGDS